MSRPLTQMAAPIRTQARPGRRQRGALAIVFALMVVGLLGFIGLSFDLAQIYNRKVELQNAADGAALAAARALVGTPAGIGAAVAAAQIAVQNRKYGYRYQLAWNDDAIRFGASPDAAAEDWLDRIAAAASPAVAGLLFARVDTAGLLVDPEHDHNRVDTVFMSVLGSNAGSVSTNGRAVAGRDSIQVTPLGVCALSTTAAAPRASGALNEAVQYGFRRGVGYNLLALNPVGTTAISYLVDPLEPAGTSSANFDTAVVAPFICSGTMQMARLPATVHVRHPFPGALSAQLNSRFGAAPLCNAVTAPPDNNVKQYVPATANLWSNVLPSGQTATSAVVPAAGGQPAHLATFADLPGTPTGAAGNYGVLWSYAMAAQWAAVEPAAGYGNLAKANWPTLYPASVAPAPSVKAAYPVAPLTPYTSSFIGGIFFTAGAAPAMRRRRVLNLPLLECTDASGANTSATVLAIGQFFMTAQASATAISGEFAGVVAQGALGGPVRLYQ